LQIEWKRRLHSGGQGEVFHDPTRFKVLACGRRWGKTRLCANIAVDRCIRKKAEWWWVAPTYDIAERGWTALYEIGAQPLILKENKVKKMITFLPGANLQFKTAENPVSLLGKGLDGLILDECARIQNDVWHRYLRPTLIDHQGEAIFISSPRGKNWFYESYLKGQDSLQTNWKSWAFPTLDNPTLNREEVEAAIADTPELIRRQEYYAEFLDEANQVFRNIRGCVRGALQEPQPGQAYSIGADLAKYQDFTVLGVLNQQGHLVAFERFNQLDWGFQKERIAALSKKYQGTVLLDSTGVGDPIFDDLKRMGLPVAGYQFTSQSKRQLIENLSIQMEAGRVSFPEIDQLINELQAFQCEISGTGTLRYGAPSGYFDDCVIALALATWQVSRIVTGSPVGHGERETAKFFEDF